MCFCVCYSRAVYCVIGHCDGKDDHSEVADKIDDYLWIKLSQLSQDADDKDTISLADLQTTLIDQYGTCIDTHIKHIFSITVLFLSVFKHL